MSDPNTNGQGPDGQNAGGQPEYGAYGPYAGNPQQGDAGADQSGQYGYGPYSQPPYGQPPYNQPGGQPGGQYYGQYTQYTQYTQGNPYGQPGGPSQQGPRPGPQAGWTFSPFRLFEQMLPQPAKNAVRALYGVLGVVAVVLGLALLVWPNHTLIVAAVILGIYLVVSGVIRIVSSLVELGLPPGWRVVNVILGILLAFGGVVAIKNAALSGTALLVMITLIVGVGWMMEGVMALLESWKLPKSGWSIVYAVISVVAGLIVLFSPLSSAMSLMIFGGIALIVMGVASIIRAFRFGRTPKNR